MKFYEGCNFTLTINLKDALFDQIEYFFFNYRVLVLYCSLMQEKKSFSRNSIEFEFIFFQMK